MKMGTVNGCGKIHSFRQCVTLADTNIPKKKSKYFILLVSLSNWKMYSNFQGGSLKCRSMSVWDMLRVEGSLQGAISAEIGTNTQGENFP